MLGCLLAALVAPAPPPAKAVNAVRIYTVYSGTCFGPGPVLVGEWRRECDGTWVGWGWKPGEYGCSDDYLEYGEACE